MTARIVRLGHHAPRATELDAGPSLTALVDNLQNENRWLRRELETSVPLADYRGLKTEIARKRDELRSVKDELRQTQKLLAAAIQGRGEASK
jgi:hypothetical protein